MANTGFNLNRGIIRNFNYTNLPPANVQNAQSINKLVSIQNSVSSFVQTHGANNIAKIQNMKTEETYNSSDLNTVTINASVTLNNENLNTTQTLGTLDTIELTDSDLNASGLTNFVTLTAS